jgi:hypothetical protein
MRIFLVTYDDPNDENEHGSNDTFVAAETPEQAWSIFHKSWLSDQLSSLSDPPDTYEEVVADELHESFRKPWIKPDAEPQHIFDAGQVFEVMLKPSQGDVGIMRWVHGSWYSKALGNDVPGVVLLHGYVPR